MGERVAYLLSANQLHKLGAALNGKSVLVAVGGEVSATGTALAAMYRAATVLEVRLERSSGRCTSVLARWEEARHGGASVELTPEQIVAILIDEDRVPAPGADLKLE